MRYYLTKLDDLFLKILSISLILFVLHGILTVPAASQESSEADQPVRLSRRDLSNILLTAQLCVHEATWAGGRDGSADCGAILQTIRHRQELFDRPTYETALRLTAPRFYAATTNRSWARHLRPASMRLNPPGWTFPLHVSAFEDRWRSVYNRTRGFYLGQESPPCDEPPTHWFGRRTDREVIQEWLGTGRYSEANCGETRNAFLYRLPVLVD